MNPRSTLLTVLCTASLSAFAQQKASRINSGEIVNTGIKLYDEGKYKEALREFDKIPVGDTNYVLALYESALTCAADSQFARGIAYCRKGLVDRTDIGRDPELLVQYASLLDYDQQQQQSLRLVDSALTVYPAYAPLYITKGTTLIRMQQYAASEKVFQQAALMAPFSSSIHYKLGLSAFNQGKIIPAFLCFWTALAVEPDGKFNKNAINFLSQISKSTDNITELLDKRTEEPADNFGSVEQIVLSKIALDKNYKIIIDLDDAISRQMQVIAEKLEFEASSQDFYRQYYVPLVKKIYDDKKFEHFVNYVFSDINIPAIQDYNKKKKKDIDALKSDIVDYLIQIRASRELQFTKRAGTLIPYQFSEGKLYGKGVIREKDITIGPWIFYFSSGNKKAEGTFNDKGQKEGDFSYYYFNGQLKGKEIYRAGKQEGPETYYTLQGKILHQSTYKGGELDGRHTTYFDNEVIKTIEIYSNGLLNGVKKTFYRSGPLQMEETFVNGKRQGPAKSYFINGKQETEGTYDNDELNGAFKGRNNEGTVTVEGSYRQGKLHGTLKRYNNDGKLITVENYENGQLEGEYLVYHENGKINYQYLNKKGKTTGDINYYDVDGKLFSTLTFDADRLKTARYFDKTGKQVSISEIKKGKLDLVTFGADGIRKTVSPYNEKGILAGTKTYYYGSGKERLLETYQDGELEGETIAFYPGGQKSYSIIYAGSERNGYYTSWYNHGGVQEEGWYGDGQPQGEWLSYDKQGKLTMRTWFLNGERNGLKTEFWPNGKLHNISLYQSDKLLEYTEYDTSGAIINLVKLPNGNGQMVTKYPNGKKYSEYTYKNGEIEGRYNYYYPDGTLLATRFYKHGLLDSTFTNYYHGGKIRTEGQYLLGEKTGMYKYYNADGKLYYTETYKFNKTNGQTIFYFPNGKIETESTMRDGERHGIYKRYAEDGSLMYQLRYEDGLELGYSYLDKSGIPAPEIPLVQGNGTLKAFYQNGQPSATMEFIDGAIHGPYQLYHPNGKVWITDNLVYDINEGERKETFADGKPRSVHTYLHDNYNGPFKIYNNKGILIEEGYYHDDDLHGEHRQYDDNGKLKQVRQYFYGYILEIK